MTTVELMVSIIIAGAAGRGESEPVARAYGQVAADVRARYPAVDLTRVETQPGSERGRAYLAEDLAAVGAAGDGVLLGRVVRLALALAAESAGGAVVGMDSAALWVALTELLAALTTLAAQPGQSIGVDLAEIEAEYVRIRDVQAGDVGVRLRRGKIAAGVEIGAVVAGTPAAGTGGHRAEIRETTVGGDLHVGDKVYVTDPHAPDEAALRTAYLHRLVAQLDALALGGVDPKAAGGEAENRLRLSAVYTALLTQEWETNREAAAEDLAVEDLQLADEVAVEALMGRMGRLARVKPLSVVEQLNRHKRLVLLGDPGSGKSTFVNFVALCMAGDLLGDATLNLALLTAPLPADDERQRQAQDKSSTVVTQPWAHGALLPVRIILRDVAAGGLPAVGERATAEHLWRFVSQELDKAGLGAYGTLLWRHLLKHGGLILLDGLDEVPEADQRREQVKAAVADLAASLGRCRLVVTSRTYAYQQQAWQLRGFVATTLAPFTPGQVHYFVERWYAQRAAVLLQDATEAQGRAELLKRAIADNERLASLVERPLLLTLTASLHAWRGGSLPERREELYADAVDLLLDQWEGQRVARNTQGEVLLMQRSLAEFLQVGRQKVLTLLYRLAFEAHASQPEAVGTADIGEEALVLGLLGLSENKALQPRLLVDYLSQRAGLLTPRGVKVYTFPHRTFQEYLAACHLTEDNFPETLAGLARSDPRWREVTLLAAAKAARGASFALWSLVDELCQRQPGAAHYGVVDDWAALLAGQAIDETVRDPVTGLAALSPRQQEKVARVVAGLVALVEQSTLPAGERALAGRILAHLGDPRPAAMTIAGMEFCYVPGDGDAQPYWLGRYPVTNRQFQAFVAAGGYGERRFWPEASKEKYWHKAGFQGRYDDTARMAPYDLGEPFSLANHPVVGITWYEAMAFCCWLGEQTRVAGWQVRLPTDGEWRHGAQGGEEIPVRPLLRRWGEQAWTVSEGVALQRNPAPARRYPWGDDFGAELSNSAASKIGATSAVGCFGGGASPYGAEEMSGNVWEWLLAEPGDLAGGAYWEDDDGVGSAARHVNYPLDGFSGVGFRCVVVPLSR